jgi:putative FmdB family regulatory protein
MPIYAYRCEACGHAKDVLQKISDPVLTVCPACGQDAFRKQVTAAGFQLKGSGWYVTDFRGGNSTASAPPAESGGAAPAPSAAPASSAPAPAPAPGPAASPTPPPPAPKSDA